jgi:hypothetical protein
MNMFIFTYARDEACDGSCDIAIALPAEGWFQSSMRRIDIRFLK